MCVIQADIRALPLPDNSVQMIYTDPPYLKMYLPLYVHLFDIDYDQCQLSMRRLGG